MRITLTEHERFVLTENIEFAISTVEDLLQVAHRTSADRHRAAGLAVTVAHLCDAIESGELDFNVPGVRDWIEYDREQTLAHMKLQAEWLCGSGAANRTRSGCTSTTSKDSKTGSPRRSTNCSIRSPSPIAY